MKRKGTSKWALGSLVLGLAGVSLLWRVQRTPEDERPADGAAWSRQSTAQTRDRDHTRWTPAIPASEFVVESVAKAEVSPIEARGEVVERRYVELSGSGGGQWESLVAVEDLPFLVRVVRRVSVDPTTGAERTLAFEEMVANRLLARPVEGVDAVDMSRELARFGARLGRRLLGESLVEIALSDPGLEAYAAALNALGDEGRSELFAYLEPDYIVHTAVEPNDAGYVSGDLWGLNNEGQDGGTTDVDIDAPEAWEARTGTASVVVAVIDTGINYEHEDLEANLWRNEAEVAGNGVDDDGNGYVDDVFGISALADSGDPFDDNGHGTHCAGTIGASGDNGIGGVGVVWTTRLMGLKFLSSQGSGALSDAIACIDYAVTMGADVLNNSWGGGGYSQALEDAILAAEASGVAFVAAAGNAGLDTDEQPFYPAGYDAGNVLSVAAVDRSGKLASFSNFGLASVDVAAPGVDISSTFAGAGDAYRSLSGTSMAAPHVSGVMALLLAEYPEDGLAANMARLRYATKELADLRGRVGEAGLVSAWRSLELATVPSPPQFTVRPDRQYIVSRGESLLVGLEVRSEQAVSFRWFREGEELAGVEGGSLSIEAADLQDAGDYVVEVASSGGVARSYFSVLVVEEEPALAEAFDAPQRRFATWGDATWEVYFADSIVGTSSLRSGDVDDGESSVLRARVNGPGRVSFYWRLSAERGWDIGSFLLDGVVAGQLFAEADWVLFSAELEEAREYELVWVYEKDASLSVGQDALFLDGFRFDAVEDSPPVIVENPKEATVGPGEHHAFAVGALGDGLRYQWLRDGQPLSGADEEVLILLNVSVEDEGQYVARVSNDQGRVESEAARLRVAEVPASILRSPESRVRSSGESVRFDALASGSLPISYQWFKDGQPLSGETSASLVIENTLPGDTGDYFVRIRNAYTAGSIDSAVATLTIEDVAVKPTIVKQPVGGYWQEGDALRLSVAAQGGQPLAYQWFREGMPLAGESGRVFERLAAVGDAGSYQALVTNAYGEVRSEGAEVVVVGGLAEALDLPEVDWELYGRQYLFPQTEVTFDGEDALETSPVDTVLPQSHGMRAEIEGPTNFGVYWRRASTSFLSRAAIALDGALQAELTGAAEWQQAWVKVPEGRHTLEFVLQNELGSRIWLDQAELTPAPVIYRQPESKVVQAGEGVSLSVDAFGAGALQYQWYRNGAEVLGANEAAYSPTGSGVEATGQYAVVVSNEQGSVESDVATVFYLGGVPDAIGGDAVDFQIAAGSDWEVWREPSGGFRLRSRKAEPGEARRLEAVAAGPGTLVASLAIRSSVCCPSLTFAVQGEEVAISVPREGESEELRYRTVYVPLEEGPALLTWEFIGVEDPLDRDQFAALREAYVTTAPVITRQPVSARALEGQRATLSLELFDETGVSYQWFREDGSPVAGAEEGELTLEDLAAADGGGYFCEVSNSMGVTTRSAVAFVEVVEGFYEAAEVDFGDFSSGAEFWEPQSEISWDGEDALAFRSEVAGERSSLWLDLDWWEGRSGSVRFRVRIEGLGANGSFEAQQPRGKIVQLIEDTDWREVVVPINDLSPVKSLVFTVSRPGAGDGGPLGIWLDDLEFVTYPVVYDEPANALARYGQSVSLEPKVVGEALVYQWYRDGLLMAGETAATLERDASFADRGRYRLVARNAEGEAWTREASLELVDVDWGSEAGRTAAFSSEGAVLWESSADGLPGEGASLSTGGVGPGERSDLFFVARGPGRFKFDWRLESSRNGERLYCYVFDTLISGIFEGDDWRAFSVYLPEEGAYPFRISLESPGGSEAPGGRAWIDALRYTEQAGNSYREWAEAAFAGSNVAEELRAREQDADGDGVANGAEYLLRFSPSVRERFPSPQFFENGDELAALLDFKMNFAARDGRIGLEVSKDLESWVPMEAFLLRPDSNDDAATLFGRVPGEDALSPLLLRLAVYFDELE